MSPPVRSLLWTLPCLHLWMLLLQKPDQQRLTAFQVSFQKVFRAQIQVMSSQFSRLLHAFRGMLAFMQQVHPNLPHPSLSIPQAPAPPIQSFPVPQPIGASLVPPPHTNTTANDTTVLAREPSQNAATAPAVIPSTSQITPNTPSTEKQLLSYAPQDACQPPFDCSSVPLPPDPCDETSTGDMIVTFCNKRGTSPPPVPSAKSKNRKAQLCDNTSEDILNRAVTEANIN